MSRREAQNEPRVLLSPEEQIRRFADVHRHQLDPQVYTRLAARTQALGLSFHEDELRIIAALGTPARLQDFLNNWIYYNNDHATPEAEETALSPRAVLRCGHAHCFEGAMFAYAVNFLHGHSPRLVLLEASQDSEHNLVLFQDPDTRLYGANAHSAFKNLDGRTAQYSSIRALAESYYPHYYSDRTHNPQDLTLVGYSEPFDLTAKFGVGWMDSELPLWDIYFTYIDDTMSFHYLFDNSSRTHFYPLVQGLKSKWIEIDAKGKPFVDVMNLPAEARSLWTLFFTAFGTSNKRERPRGRAKEIEKKFQKLTGTTPIDLLENVEELEKFLEKGYRQDQLLTRGN